METGQQQGRDVWGGAISVSMQLSIVRQPSERCVKDAKFDCYLTPPLDVWRVRQRDGICSANGRLHSAYLKVALCICRGSTRMCGMHPVARKPLDGFVSSH